MLGLDRLGRGISRPRHFEAAALGENGPGDAGELVGQRNRQDVVVQPLFGRLDPGLQPIAFPLLGPNLDQHDPGCLNEQRT